MKIFENLAKAELAVPSQTSRLVKIGEERICLVNQLNNFYALADRCPHMGASLSEGKINFIGEVICPLHEYRFNSKTGQECANKCEQSKTYLIRVDDSGVYIQLN